MKQIIKLVSLFIFFYIVFISALSVKATAPRPNSFVEETTIAGIVPIGDENVEVNQAIFDLDFYGGSGINVVEHIEKSANLKMTYDLTYDGNNESVMFCLPFLNKLFYLNQDVKIFVEGVEIEPTLNISPQYHYDAYGSYTRMVEQNFLTEYRKSMIKDYNFAHDVEGYQYTVKNPKTHGKNFFVNTSLSFINVPIDTVFMDINGFNKDQSNVKSYWGTYESEEEFIFFSSSNLTIESESIEVEQHNSIYIDRGVRLDNPTITKKVMRLSEYLDSNTFSHHRFLDSQKMFYYYNIDQQWNNSDIYHIYQSKNILNTINNNYYEMSLDFKVDFYKPQIQVIIQLPIPIHCYREDMTIVVVANPANKINEFGKLFVNTHINEDLISSSESHTKENSRYQWMMDEITTLEMVYTNSSYNQNIVALGLFIILASLFALVIKYILSYIIPFLLISISILTVFLVLRFILRKKKQR